MMKKVLLVILLASLMLGGCSSVKKPETLHVIKSGVYYDAYSGYETETKYYHDEVFVRSDGIYVVKGHWVCGDESANMYWYYSPTGMFLGDREYDSYGNYTDSFGFVERTLDDYIRSRDDFDYLANDVIYYEDGSYEEIVVENDVIIESTCYDCFGQITVYFEFDEYGNVVELKFYDSYSAEPYAVLRNKYKDVDVE